MNLLSTYLHCWLLIKCKFYKKKKNPTKPYVISPATVKGNLRYDITSTKCLIYQKKLELSSPVRGNQWNFSPNLGN